MIITAALSVAGWYVVGVRAVVALLVAASGCADDFNTLSEFTPSLHAVAPTTLSEEPDVAVSLRVRPLVPYECPRFDPADLRGTFGDIALQFTRASYVEAFGTSGGADYCSLGFRGVGLPNHGLVTVSDSSLEVRAMFDEAAVQMRTASHPTWTFARGEMVAIRWSPAVDLVDSPLRPDLSLNPSNDMPLVATLVAPDLVTFTIPLGYPPGPKSGYLSFFSSQYDQPAVTCENASSCRVYQNRAVLFDAVVE